MSAKVNRSIWGGWIGHCDECGESIGGASNPVHAWADVHNDDNHREWPVT